MKPAAIVFDLYGTILRIDALHAAVSAAGITETAAFIDAWRTKQIEYSWCVSLMEEYRDFDSLTRSALEYVLARFGAELDEVQTTKLAGAWLDLDPYPDVAPALRVLRSRGVPLVVLTNGVAASAERALRSGGVRDAIDEILSVESVRVYKPDARVYSLVTKRFTCSPADVLFVSSNGWDASGGAAFGFRVAWCNRAQRPAETLGYPPATTISTLAEVAAIVD
ncbi:MAG: haloacid dehalogenase type II [Candidatus Velthaea sp.]